MVERDCDILAAASAGIDEHLGREREVELVICSEWLSRIVTFWLKVLEGIDEHLGRRERDGRGIFSGW